LRRWLASCVALFTDIAQELIDRGHTVNCVQIFQGWMEARSFEEYANPG
jgi:hypothetical protein